MLEIIVQEGVFLYESPRFGPLLEIYNFEGRDLSHKKTRKSFFRNKKLKFQRFFGKVQIEMAWERLTRPLRWLCETWRTKRVLVGVGWVLKGVVCCHVFLLWHKHKSKILEVIGFLIVSRFAILVELKGWPSKALCTPDPHIVVEREA